MWLARVKGAQQNLLCVLWHAYCTSLPSNMRDCTPNLPTDMRLLNKIAQPVARRAPKSPCKVLSRTQRGKMFPGPGQATVLGAVVFQAWASAAGLQLRHSRKLDTKKREACLSLLVILVSALTGPSAPPCLLGGNSSSTDRPHVNHCHQASSAQRNSLEALQHRQTKIKIGAGRRGISGSTSGAGYFENS